MSGSNLIWPDKAGKKRNKDILCLEDIPYKDDIEYANELKTLPHISCSHCVNIRKRKVENAGFMFYIKYEVPILLLNEEENTKKSKNNKRMEPIEEIFLYKDKIDYMLKLEKSMNKNNVDENKTRSDNKDDKKKNQKNKKGNEEDDEIKQDEYDNKENNNGGDNIKGQFKKGSNLIKKCIDQNIDVYDVLGVEETDDLETIKSCYKKLILLFHPDKNKGTAYLNEKEKEKNKKKKGKNKKTKYMNNNTSNNNNNENENEKDFLYFIEKYNIEKLTNDEKKNIFLKIQDSYTILSDKILRKQYDSSIPFDESVPTLTQLEEAKNFYTFLRPVFKRNAKWSAIKPVPDIGDENTDIKDVKYFYDFWYNFNNWRDFSYQNEYDYEQAECREERRWMERENKKIQKKASKTENLRIIKLVDLAYNNDPRIIAENKRIKLEKLKKKEQAMIEKKNQQNENHNNINMDNIINNNNNNNNNNLGSHKKNIDKASIKLWKHHIKSLCLTKLSNLVNAENIQEKLSLMSFDNLCEFIYDIYVILNFTVPKNNTDTTTTLANNIKNNTLHKKIYNHINEPKKSFQSQTSTSTNNNENNNNNISNDGRTNTGFIAHLKNLHLDHKQILTLIDTFKKYIQDHSFIIENKLNQLNNQHNCQIDTHSNNQFIKDEDQTDQDQANQDQANQDQVNQDQANQDQANQDQANQDQANQDHIHPNTHANMDSQDIMHNNISNNIPYSNNEKIYQHVKKENEETNIYSNDSTQININESNEHVYEHVKKENEQTNLYSNESTQSNINIYNEKNNEDNESPSNKWSAQEVSLLAKALKLYPGGTRNRWVLISNSIKTKNVKEVIKKTKEMFENDTLKNLGRNFDETPFDHFKNQNKGVMKKIYDNLDKREYKLNKENNNQFETDNLNGDEEKKKPWTHEEQHLLEQALMKYPASIPIKERLKLVSQELKTRTVDEVILRMKTLRAQIMAKKSSK
ncbi:putative DNA-binding chaperone [Plasmodium gaboni]|uniref:Putative DNA-binding chaperone n=1 Tax=Plasmodium gaboni TaxID=647221 RepID=A0A151LGI5_9APIC|nr:putative DNA-binding chaperone [Plasmodium gaboni]KYN97979.1 putative DNA-binding chaperone [Plasmodium gaboni]